jgi:hypothetical protein
MAENEAERAVVRSYGQWVARWDAGFFGINGRRYYTDDPDKLREKFTLLARTNRELCLQLWRDFDAGYWDVMAKVEVEIDPEEIEQDEGSPWWYRCESEKTEQEETERDSRRTEQVYNRRSWQFLSEFTEEERREYWSRVRKEEDEKQQRPYRQLVEACLGAGNPRSGGTPAIVREIREAVLAESELNSDSPSLCNRPEGEYSEIDEARREAEGAEEHE